MKTFTNEELKKAYYFWRRHYESKTTDYEIEPFLQPQILPYQLSQKSWLKKARLGHFLSAQTVANKLKIARAAYSQYEENEKKGTISLATLAKAAEAMECELVYAIRPKSKITFSKIIWNKLFKVIAHHPWLEKCDQHRRGEALAKIAVDKMKEPQFRKQQSWSQRVNNKKLTSL